MTAELDLLKVMGDREILEKHFSRIPVSALTEESKQLLGYFQEYFTSTSAPEVDPSFDSWLWLVKAPVLKEERKDALKAMLERLHNHVPEHWIVEALAKKLHEQALAEEVLFRCQQYLDGKGEALDRTAEFLSKQIKAGSFQTAEKIIADTRILKTWDEVQMTMDEEPGWKWRLSVLNKSFGKLRPRKLILFGARPDRGKCLGYNTPVMMADGTIKPVQDIVAGDMVMGPDYTPRKVTSIARGREKMVRVNYADGTYYRCNESHILSLRNWFTGEVVNVSAKEYMSWPEIDQLWHLGWKSKPGGEVVYRDIFPNPEPEGDYYGFTLEGPDRLFLLGDFTVTHNTAALLSESLYLIKQFPEGKKVLFISSEEDPNDIYFRAYTNVRSTFGAGVSDITHRFQVFHSGLWTTEDLYAVFDSMRDEIGIIAFNPLYNIKIKGHKERDTNYFEEISKWARNMAIEFNCPVFTAAQLSESGDNKKIVDMTHIYFSKTGTPAALDGAVLIGSTNDSGDEGYRWINVAKNKFFAPDSLKDPSMIRVWGHKVIFDGANSIIRDVEV